MKTKKILRVAICAQILLTSLVVNAQGDTGSDNGSGSGSSTGPNSTACIPGASNWFVGGNIITPPGGATSNPAQWALDIGTCNNFPFILKANNFKSLFILPNGNIGFEQGNPLRALQIRKVEPTIRLEATGGNNPHSWDMISSGGLGSLNSGYFGITDATSNAIRFAIDAGGNVGVGTNNPGSKFQVVDPYFAEINVTGSGNNPSRLSLTTWNQLSYYFANDMNIGHIGVDDAFGEHPLINFAYNNIVTPTSEQVWIGNTKPQGIHSDFKFAVEGKIVAQSVYVTPTGLPNWADYVFAENYELIKLADLENFYLKNKHLPEVPTTKEVSEKGIDLGAMNALLLKKVEELTLYIVDLNKKVEVLQAENKKSSHK